MQLLEAALSPISLEEFKQHYQEGKCLVVEGAASKFDGLVSLNDIERRLNDGSNANAFAQAIDGGQRHPLLSHNTPWTTAALRKAEFLQHIEQGKSFMMSNSSQVSRGLSRLCDELESCFVDDSAHADVHLYVSLSAQGGSYHAHRDRPQHKLLLQVEGEAHWQLFEEIGDIPDEVQAITPDEQDELLKLASEFTLTKGSLLYMPPGTFHRVVAVGGPRISVSIPFYAMPQADQMDRSHIPFAKLFESQQTADAKE